MRRRATAAVLGLVAAAALAAPALTAGGYEDPKLQYAEYTLTEREPGAPTGQSFSVDYVNPSDPAAKPPPVRRVVTILPRGARFDTGALAHCEASDAALMAEGPDACPPESKITDGIATVDTGFPEPGRYVTADIAFFNNDHELINLNTVRGSGARTVIRATVEGRRVTTDAPMLPGTPPDGGAIDTAVVNDPVIVNEVDGELRSYITTPRVCRGRKDDPHWTTRVEFTYDGDVTETVNTHTPCVRKAKR